MDSRDAARPGRTSAGEGRRATAQQLLLHGECVLAADATGSAWLPISSHIERAFTSAVVTLDFAGFSGETLNGAIQEPMDKIRVGRLTPESIAIRILLPDMTIPMGLPCRAEDLSDDPAIRDRANRIMLRNTQAIADTVEELARLGLVANATAEVRVYGGVPLFKLYIVNKEEAFFGFYPVVRHTVPIGGEQREIFDPMRKDATLFQWSTTDDKDSTSSQFVEQAQTWFDGMWTTVGREVVTQ